MRCQLARTRAREHARRGPDDIPFVSLINFDYCYLKSSKGEIMRSEGGDAELGRSQQPWATTLVRVDESTGMVMAIAVPMKAADQSYVQENIMDFSRRAIYLVSRVRVDGEPALVTVVQKAVETLIANGFRINLELAPKCSSKALGPVGQAQRKLQEQVRCLKTDLEVITGAKIDADMSIWTWLVRRSAWAIERYKAGGNGRTAYQDKLRRPIHVRHPQV